MRDLQTAYNNRDVRGMRVLIPRYLVSENIDELTNDEVIDRTRNILRMSFPLRMMIRLCITLQ